MKSRFYKIANNVKEKVPLIALDFDETVVKSDDEYNIKGFKLGTFTEKEVEDAPLQAAKEIKRRGWRIAIWTCRADDLEESMIEWLDSNDFPYDTINENPWFETGSRKMYYDVLIDDRAGFDGNWDDALKYAEKMISEK